MSLNLNVFDELHNNLGDLFETEQINLSQYVRSHEISKKQMILNIR